MKHLFLLRHAHSTSNVPDFDRVLNEEGVAKCQKVAVVLEPFSKDIDLVLCSSSVRTSQTIRNVLPDNPVHYSKEFYNSSALLLLDHLREVSSKHNDILLVTHNNAISDLASLLSDRKLKFTPGGLALYDCDIESWSQLDSQNTELMSFWR